MANVRIIPQNRNPHHRFFVYKRVNNPIYFYSPTVHKQPLLPAVLSRYYELPARKKEIGHITFSFIKRPGY